jgi:hypothetical protein
VLQAGSINARGNIPTVVVGRSAVHEREVEPVTRWFRMASLPTLPIGVGSPQAIRCSSAYARSALNSPARADIGDGDGGRCNANASSMSAASPVSASTPASRLRRPASGLIGAADVSCSTIRSTVRGQLVSRRLIGSSTAQ